MQINHFLENSAEKFPDKKAVWYTGKWMTFGELDTAANKLANFMIKIGTKKEDRIAVLIENSFDYVISYFAILKVGGIVVALNTDTTSGALAPRIQKIVADVFSPAKLYIMYGATEASARLSYLHPDRLSKKWGSIGKAIPNVELYIADENGKRMPANTDPDAL